MCISFYIPQALESSPYVFSTNESNLLPFIGPSAERFWTQNSSILMHMKKALMCKKKRLAHYCLLNTIKKTIQPNLNVTIKHVY